MIVWDSSYYKNLGDPLLASSEQASVSHAFAMFVERESKATPEYPMALFYRHETHAHMHCEWLLYIPPHCAAFALSIKALPCAKPQKQDLAIFAGSAQALAYWFKT